MSVLLFPSEQSDLVVFEQRDEILLEGSKWGQKRNDRNYVSASDEEILPLGDISESEDEENDDSEEDDEEVSDGHEDDNRSLMDEDEQEKEDVDKEAWGLS